MGTAAIITAIASVISALGGLFARPAVDKKIAERKARKQAQACVEPVPPPPIGKKPH